MVQLTRNEYDILVTTLAWVGGFTPLFVQALRGTPRWTWVQSVGLALVLVPFARMGVNVALTFGDLFTTYTVLQPASPTAMWRSVGRTLLYSFAFPAVGLLLLHNAFPGWWSRRVPRGTLAGTLDAHGLAPRRSWRQDALHGLALFFVIALAYVAAFLLSRSALSFLYANGDESRYWIHITIPLILLLSGTAGLVEEFLFRGILLRAFSRWMPFALAALLQALAFGLVHSGYGTWAHLAGPFVFGLGMAVVARTLGVLTAALLHAEINIVFFALEVSGHTPEAWALIVLLAGLNVVAALLTRLEAVRLLWGATVGRLRKAA